MEVTSKCGVKNYRIRVRAIKKPRVLNLYCWILRTHVSDEELSVQVHSWSLNFFHTNCRRQSIDMQQFIEVNRTTTVYIIIIYIQVTLFLLCFQMGCRCSFSRRDGEQGAMRMSLAAKFFCFDFSW